MAGARQTSRRGLRALPRSELQAATASDRLGALGAGTAGFAALERVCADEARAHAPEPRLGRDPRDGVAVTYSPARAARLAQAHCVVCDAETCSPVDVADLPPSAPDDAGDPDCAWLTPNLYPNVYPFPARGPVRGVHLVQWSSRHHDRGLPGAPAPVAVALLRQLARAEEWLLHHAPESYRDTGDGHRGHVGIIKNRGHLVGGSVEHDHQQILIADVAPAAPRRVHGLGAELLRDAPADLTIDDVDGLATTLAAPFMRRPLHAFIVPATATRQPEAGHLHHLPPDVLDALALATARLTAAVSVLMAEPAWNLVVHTGHARGPLVELLAYTQPLGGYEHLGLYMCEELPSVSAARLREALPR